MSTYRNLRKQGVVFPPREASTRFMVSSMGLESPMFDFLEEVSHSKGKPRYASVGLPRPQLREEKERLHAEKEFKRFIGGNIGVISREKDSKSLAKVTLSQADINTIKNYMEIIDDICVNAENVSDVKTDFALEIYKNAQAFHARCLNIVAAKSAHGVGHQLEVLLSLSEDLDNRIKLYKNTFIDLFIKKNAPKEIIGENFNGKSTDKNNKEDINKAKEIKEEKKATTKNLSNNSKKKRNMIKPLPPPPSNQFFQFETKQEPLADLLEFLEETKSSEKNPFAVSPERKSLLDVKVDLEYSIKEKSVEADKVEDDFFESLANRKA
jgi:hypothetical protein